MFKFLFLGLVITIIYWIIFFVYFYSSLLIIIFIFRDYQEKFNSENNFLQKIKTNETQLLLNIISFILANSLGFIFWFRFKNIDIFYFFLSFGLFGCFSSILLFFFCRYLKFFLFFLVGFLFLLHVLIRIPILNINFSTVIGSVINSILGFHTPYSKKAFINKNIIPKINDRLRLYGRKLKLDCSVDMDGKTFYRLAIEGSNLPLVVLWNDGSDKRVIGFDKSLIENKEAYFPAIFINAEDVLELSSDGLICKK